jgi:hypothetical protein
VKLGKPILAGLPFDFIYGILVNFKRLEVLFITAGIGPTITAFVITKSTQNPTDVE